MRGDGFEGLKQLPEANLFNFGKDPRVIDVEEMVAEEEKYLIKVIKPKSTSKSMDELRHDMYHHSKVKSFVEIPPTSLETRGHCLRGIYNTYLYRYAMCVKSMPILNPKKDYAYEEADGLLIASKYTKLYLEDLIQPCNCKACTTIRCNCRAAGIPCCVYCKCSGNVPPCKNPKSKSKK